VVEPFLPKGKEWVTPYLENKPLGYRENQGFRRLGKVLAPSGKTRIVALFDYWTQTVLRPFHLYIIKM
jgi:hypothetical protein